MDFLDSCPKRRADVTNRSIDGDRVVLDQRTGRLHRLNASASLVWALCDGTRTSDEIAEGVAEAFAETPSTFAEEIREILRQFMDLGLLEPAPCRRQSGLVVAL